MLIRNVMLIALIVLAGCQLAPERKIPYGFARGGALSEQEYALIEPYVRSQTWDVRVREGEQTLVPAARYVYAFVSDFDPKTIRRVIVGSFEGRQGLSAQLAADLQRVLVEELNDRDVLASVGDMSSPGSVMVSGAVTHAEPAVDGVEGIGIQAEARITQGGRSVGAIQINFIAVDPDKKSYVGPPGLMLADSIYRAIVPQTLLTTARKSSALYLSLPFRDAMRTAPNRRMSESYAVTTGMLTPNTGYPPLRAATAPLTIPQRR